MRIEGPVFHMDAKVMQNNVPKMQPDDKRVHEFDIVETELLRGIKAANDSLESYNRKTEFSIHEKTGDIMIKVYDTRTNEVIKEIPPQKIKDMIANMLERAGLLIDKRA